MEKWTGTIIGGGLGWALGGPLGGLIGAYIGSKFTNTNVRRIPFSHPYGQQQTQQRTTMPGDFAVAMLSLFGYVSKADDQVLSSEIQYVKKYLLEKFGAKNAQELMYLFKELLKKDYDIREVTRQIKMNMDYYSRLELIHVLFGIAKADGNISSQELYAIREIMNGLDISSKDFDSIKSIFIGETNQAYEILNVSPESEIDTIKKAYRELAMKYHPDKVANLGSEFQQLAEDKFKAINNAYQTVRKEKGF